MIEHLSNIADILLVVGPFTYWLYRQIKKLDTTVTLTKQVASSHLPFIYGRMRTYDEALNLDSPFPPPIGIVNGNGK